MTVGLKPVKVAADRKNRRKANCRRLRQPLANHQLIEDNMGLPRSATSAGRY
jgi:hypothetical protein